MRLIDVEQGTFEWLEARIGIPTASRFSAIVTPKERKWIAAAGKDYALELVTERLLNAPLGDVTTIWMDRGTDLEGEARRWYEMARGVSVQEVGFAMRDDMDVGGSPDGLVGEDGLVEIKCRAAKNHLRCVLGYQDTASPTQVQGLLWITGREWCDVVSYCPGLPQRIERVHRDPEWMDTFDRALPVFLAGLDKLWRKVGAIGAADIDGDSLEAELEASVAALYGGAA